MAKMSTSGMDDLARQLFEMGESTGEIAEKMVIAGAEKMVSQWKYEIQKYNHIEDGDLIDSITHGKPKAMDNALTVEIYAQGKRNGLKAFMTHYGTSNKDGTHWVDEAEEKAKNKCTRAVQEVFDEEMRKRGFN